MTGRTDARVAVIMTCYNEGPYIGEAVKSVLSQTRSDLISSIVIADDGSEPTTLEVLRDIEGWDGRISVKYGPGGAGLPAQRNWALSSVDCPFFAILDGDDLWTSDKLELQMPVIQCDDTVGLVYSSYFTFPDHMLSAARLAKVLDLTSSPDLTKAYFLNDPPIIPSTTLIRRSVFEACGGFDPSIRVFEDTDLYLRLSSRCRFAFVNKPLLYKRNRGASITGGRRDLMAYHAFVALKAAAEEPRLLPLVARRLAERARKLGNQRYLLGDAEEASRLLRFATQVDVLNWRAWASLTAANSVSTRRRKNACRPAEVAARSARSGWSMMTPEGIIVLTCEYPPFPGGIGTVSGRLVDAVRVEGHSATVIAPAYPDLPPVPSDPETSRILGTSQDLAARRCRDPAHPAASPKIVFSWRLTSAAFSWRMHFGRCIVGPIGR